MSKKTKIILSALFGGLFFADGLYLILQNKIHLGTILPLVLGCLLLLYSYFYQQIQAILLQHPIFKMVWTFGWTMLTVWLISLLVFFAYLQHKIQNQTMTPPVQAIIVLGSGIENGQPSAILAQRLNTAAALAQQQSESIVIVTGGLDYGESQTEAEIMAHYLHEHFALDPQRIYLEDQSTSTELNLVHSKSILQQHDILLDVPIAIVTSDFHTLRADAIARKQGYAKPIMVSAPTPILNRYNAWLREYFAFISGWLLNEY